MQLPKFIKTIRWKRWLLRLGIFLVLALTALYFIAPSMILYPRRINWPRTVADFDLPGENITVTGADSVQIKAIWVHRQHDSINRPVMILFHGIGNCKERWLPTAQWLWRDGFETVLIDQRAHGESGGQFCTYGFYEKRDAQAVVEYILQQRPDARIGVWGHSLGGAVALQTMAIEPRIQFGVIESTFATFDDVVYDYQMRMFKLPWRSFANDAIRRAAEQGHFDPQQVRPVEAARQIHQPIFYGHGDQDEKISIRYGKAIFANLASTDKQFYSVPGGDHSNVATYGGEPYRKAIEDFLLRVGGIDRD